MKVGFIGCGGFTSGNHLPNVAKNPELEISGLCDLNTAHLEELKLMYNPDYITDDMENIFNDPSIEMVICGTKPDFRLPIMKLAVKHNKPLFVEKPLCFNDKDIMPMLELMKDAPIPFMVGFNRPYSPMMQDIKPLYQELKQGSATIIYRIVGEARLWPKHHYDAVVVDNESTIIHEITHIFDLLNWLTDLVPTRIYTAGEGNMDNIITLNYPNQVTAVIIAGDNSYAGYPKERIEINTGYSTIVGDNFTETLAYCANGRIVNKKYPYTIGEETFTTSAVEATSKTIEWRNSVTDEDIEKGYYYESQVKVDKGHYNELDFFRRTVLGKVAIETGVTAGALAQLTASAAIKSWEQKQAKKLDFEQFYSN